MGCGASQPAVDVGGAAKATASKPAAAAPKLAPTNPPTLPPPSEDAGDREWWEELMTPGTVSEFYELGKVLGRGASSVVREAHNKETRERVACKVMHLQGKQPEERAKSRDRIMREVEVWGSLGHVNILNLIEFFVNDDAVTLVMELCKGSTLLDEVLTLGSYTADTARLIFSQVLEGLQHMHENDIVHRDIKLENLLLQSKRNLSSVKVADMGFATRLSSRGKYTSMAGTPAYLAPEMVKVITGRPGAEREFGTATDMWSAGVSLFILLGGYPPYDADTTKAVFKRILLEEVEFDRPVWTSVPDDARDLVLRLLEKNPRKRLTAEQALNHPFMVNESQHGTFEKKPSKDMGESFAHLREYIRTSSQVTERSISPGRALSHDDNDELAERSLMEDSMDESIAPSTFLEMQKRHEASHGRHLNESLRKIFNRNANQPAVERPSSKQGQKTKVRPTRRPKRAEERHTEEEAFSTPVTDATFKRVPQFYRAGTPNTDKF